MNGEMESVTDDMKVFVADVVPLIEAKTDDKGTIPIKIIDPGWGSSGYYSREVLQAAANSRVYYAGTQMFWNHPSKSDEKERRTRPPPTLAGVLTEDARWDEHGPKGPGVYARAKVFSAYREHVAEMGPYIGLSHYVWGESKPARRRGRRVTSSPGSSPPARSISSPCPAAAGPSRRRSGPPGPRTDRRTESSRRIQHGRNYPYTETHARIAPQRAPRNYRGAPDGDRETAPP